MDVQDKLVNLDYAVVVGYLVVLLLIGFWTHLFPKKNKDPDQDIFLGGRNFTWPVIGLSIFSTNITAMELISKSEAAYKFGMAPVNFEWLAFIFLMLLGMVFVPHYLKNRITTMPEFLKNRFGEPTYRVFSFNALLSITFFWLGGTLYGGGLFFAELMDWELWQAVLFLAGIATSFTVVGGLSAIMRTEIYQSVLIIFATLTLSILGYYQIGGWEELQSRIPESRNNFWELFRPADDKDFPWTGFVFGYPVLGVFYFCAEQTIVQRVLAARNIKHAQGGTVFTAFLKILMPVLLIFPGIIGLALMPDLGDEEAKSVYLHVSVEVMPTGLAGLMVAALIATLTGTLASGLNSFSTVFTMDIYNNTIGKGSTQTQLRRAGQILILLAALMAVLIALGMDQLRGMSLFGILQGILAILAPPTSATFLLGVLWRRGTPQAGFVTILVGTIISLGVGAYHFTVGATPEGPEWWPPFLLISAYLFAVFAVMFVVISLLTPEKKDNPFTSLVQTYRNLDPDMKSTTIWVLWGLVFAIMLALYLIFN